MIKLDTSIRANKKRIAFLFHYRLRCSYVDEQYLTVYACL